MIRNSILCFLILGLIGSAGIVSGQDLTAFKVIVNSSNPVSAITTAKLSDLFLKKVSKWDNGMKVMPVDLSDRSSVRDAFSRTVLNKTPLAVKSYWQQQLFSGRNVPPPEKAQDSDVIAFIKANPGAIGYVSAATKTEDVKQLKISE